MKSNVLAMNEDEMKGTVSGLDKCYTNTESAVKSVPAKFSNLKSSGLFDSGISAISKQLSGLTSSIFNVKNIVQKHSTQIFELDRQMAKQAEKIEIPQDFVKNNSMQTNTFNQTILEKLDGKAVTSGQGLTNVDEIANSTVTAQTLTNITKNNDMEQKHLDDSSIINKQMVTNINDGTSGDVKTITDSTNVTEKHLTDINNENGLTEQTLNDNTTIMSRNLTDMNNNQSLSQQEINSASTVTAQNLGNIATDVKPANQELTDNYGTIAAANIAVQQNLTTNNQNVIQETEIVRVNDTATESATEDNENDE